MKSSSRHPKAGIALLIACIAVCIIAGSSGSVFTTPKITTWYASLEKPWFTPPSWVFGPVWISLFTLMGISLYLVIRNGMKDPGVRKCLYIFTVQFALNIMWSFAFFGLESPALGMTVIAFLWVAIAATIWEFMKVSGPAAYILLPYIIWVSIAASLNYGVLVLN